jgi:hypothetical protein
MSTNIKNKAARPAGAGRRAGLAKVPIAPVIVPSEALAVIEGVGVARRSHTGP